MTNDKLYNQAMEAVDKLFSDKSVSIETAIINLNTLREEIDVYIQALETDLEMQASHDPDITLDDEEIDKRHGWPLQD